MHKITLIPGDGIGPSISEVAVRVIEATGVKVEWEEVEAGLPAIDKYKDPLPPIVLESIERTRVALKGPLTTPVGSGFRSVNVALRKEFDLPFGRTNECAGCDQHTLLECQMVNILKEAIQQRIAGQDLKS